MDLDVTLVKLGGSLITRKDVPDTARPALIDRLARQLARAQHDGEHLVVGHGSGSFGHPAARRAGLVGMRQASRTASPVDVARVQQKAGELHRMVLDALIAAGAAPFSIPPSAVAAAKQGRIEHFHSVTVCMALENGFMPLVYGDVVLDRACGASICSTESALTAVADALRAVGWRVRRCLWLGATPGVLTANGDTLQRVSLADANLLRSAAGPATATDVTGGMLHRVNAALTLARAGIPSWIGDGETPGVLQRLLAGATVPGTLVVP